MIALAIVYTTPFTNRLIPVGVWWYGEGAVLATVWHTPLEEYLFFALQPILTALWLFQVRPSADRSLAIPRTHRLLGVAGGVAIAVVGWVLLGDTATYYLAGCSSGRAGPRSPVGVRVDVSVGHPPVAAGRGRRPDAVPLARRSDRDRTRRLGHLRYVHHWSRAPRSPDRRGAVLPRDQPLRRPGDHHVRLGPRSNRRRFGVDERISAGSDEFR